jgi:PAS domain S-box-containing protein
LGADSELVHRDRSSLQPLNEDVAAFLRRGRSLVRTQRETIDRLESAQTQRREARRARSAQVAAGESLGVGSLDNLHEIVAREEELGATIDDLRAQIEVLTRSFTLLERERSMYVDLFEQAPDPYVVTNLMGSTQDANIATCKLLSVARDFLQGRPLISFVAQQDTRTFRTFLVALREAGPDGPPRTLTLRMRPRGRPVFVAAVRASVVCTGSGDPVALRWTFRTANPRESEARQRMAEGELARMIALEMHGPLTSLIGWVRTLRHGRVRDYEEREQGLARIEDAASAQREMLDDLAELGDLYEDSFAPAEWVELGVLTRRAIGALGLHADRERFVLLDDAQNVVRGDGPRLQRAVELLLARAIAGTPIHSSSIRIRVWVEESEAIVDIEAPMAASTPAGWSVRMASVARIAEVHGGHLVLSDEVPSARLSLPRAR